MLPQMPTSYYNPPATTGRPSEGFKYGKKSIKYNGIKYKTYPEGNKLRRYYFRFFPLGKEITINNLHKFNKNADCAFKAYQLHKWQVAGEDRLDAGTTAKILFDNQECLHKFFDQPDKIDADKYCQIICAKTELKQLLLSKNTTQKVCQQTICKNQDLVELLYRSNQLTNEEKGDLLVANPEIILTAFNTTVLTHQQVIDIICSCEALQRIVFESEGGNLECAKCICKQPILIARLLNSEGNRQKTISMISKIFIKEPSLISCYTPLGGNGLSLPDLIEIVSLAPQLISTIFSFEHIKPEQCAHFIEKLQQTGLTPLFTRNQINKFNDEYQTKTKNHHSLKTLGTTAVKPNQEYQFLANYLLLMLASNPEYLCATCRCLENNPLRLINGFLYITLDKNFFAVTSKEQLTPAHLLATAKHKNIHSPSYLELVQPLTGEYKEIFSPIDTLMKGTSDMLNGTKTAQHQKSCEDEISHLKAVQTNVEILKKLLAEEVTKLTSQSTSLSKNDSGTHLFSLETSNQAADGNTYSGSMEREPFRLQETLKVHQDLQSSYENYSHQINQTIHNLQGLLQSLKQLHNSSKQGEKVDMLTTLDVLSGTQQSIERVKRCSTEIFKLNNLATQSIEAAKDHTQPNANTSVHSTATQTNSPTNSSSASSPTKSLNSSTAPIDITKAGNAHTTSSSITSIDSPIASPTPSTSSIEVTGVDNANTTSSPISSIHIIGAEKTGTDTSPTKSLNSSAASMDSSTTFIEGAGVDNTNTTSSSITPPNSSTSSIDITETGNAHTTSSPITPTDSPIASPNPSLNITKECNANTMSSPTVSIGITETESVDTNSLPTSPLNSSTTSTNSLTTPPNPSTPLFNKTETDENTGTETSLTKPLNSSTTFIKETGVDNAKTTSSPITSIDSPIASPNPSNPLFNETETDENTGTETSQTQHLNLSTTSLNSSTNPLNSPIASRDSLIASHNITEAAENTQTNSPTNSSSASSPTKSLNSSTSSIEVTGVGNANSMSSSITSIDSPIASPTPSTSSIKVTGVDNANTASSPTKSLTLNAPTQHLNSSATKPKKTVTEENANTDSPTNSSSSASSPTKPLNSSTAPLNITETGNANTTSSPITSIDSPITSPNPSTASINSPATPINIPETQNTDESAAPDIQNYPQKFISTFTELETTAQRIRKETPNKSQASSYSSGKLILLVKKLKKYLAESNEADSDMTFIQRVDNKLSEMKMTLDENDENKVDDELSKQILTICTMWESIKSLEIPSGELSKALATATEEAKQPTATLKRTSVNLNSPTTQEKSFLYSDYLPKQPNSALFRSKSMQNLTGNGESKNKGNNQPELGPNQLTRAAIQNLKKALKENTQKTLELTSTYKQLNDQMNYLYLLLISINGENNNNARSAFTNQAKEIFNQLVTSIQQFEREAEDTDAVKTAKENLETHFNSLFSSLSHDNLSQMGSTIDDSTPDNGKTTLASPSSNKFLDNYELRTPLDACHISGSVAKKGTQLVTGLNDKYPPNFLVNVFNSKTTELKRSQSVFSLGLNDNGPSDDLASKATTSQRSQAEFVLGRSNEFRFIQQLTYDED